MRNAEGDIGLLREMAALFRADTPARLARLNDSYERGDCASLREVAHLLKGAAANFGATATWKVALDLERSAKCGNLAHSARHKEGLERGLCTLCKELEIHLN